MHYSPWPPKTTMKPDRESLEFKDGIIQSYLTQPSNSISTNIYTVYNCPKLLLWFCIKPGNLFLIICASIVSTFGAYTTYAISFFLFPLFTSFLLFALRHIKFDLSSRKSDYKINQSTTSVCRK